MTPERWRRLDDLFARAGELPAAERAAFAADACGHDAELHEELRSLLASAADTAEAAGGAAIARTIGSAAAALTMARIGPYRVLGLIGEGGMGTVYLAERADAEYRRKVAIKVLRGDLASPHAVARFRDERQVLAALDHPGIVRLLDGGRTDDDVPYLVMEHIDGRPFATHARALPVRERVAMVIRVAEALQYAHQHLVVHRDVKPSNLIVDRDGAPRLLDFGIAKLLDPDAHREAETRTGTAAFTIEYCSPEQVRGEPVSVATDVYSLGAVLYDILVGQPPQRAGATTMETLANICDCDPPRPSVAAPALRRELAGDLDNILLRALAKRPDRRYASIAAFADDLRRYLAGLPVRARDATLRYRAGKLVRRHRGKLALAALVVAALSATTVVSIVQARRADASAREARRRFDDARAMANSLIFEVDEAIRDIAGTTAARELVVSRALEYLDRLASSARGDAALGRELAYAYMRIGDIQGNGFIPNLGQVDAALDSYGKAEPLLIGVDVATRAARAHHALGLGVLYFSRSDFDRIDEPIARGFALLAALPPDVVDRLTVAHALGALHNRARSLGRLAEGRAAVARLAALVQTWDPADPTTRFWRSGATFSRADFAGRAGDPEAAVAGLREVIALLTELAAEYPTVIRYARERMFTSAQLGIYQGGAGDNWLWVPSLADRGAAEASFRDALGQVEALIERDPGNAEPRYGRSQILTSLGLAVAERSPREAVELYERALAGYDGLPAEMRDSPFVRNSKYLPHCAAADALAVLGRADEARARIRRGLELAEGANLPKCRFLAGRALRRLRDRDGAANLLDAAAADLRPHVGEEDLSELVGLTEVLAELAEVRPADRCALAREALAGWRTRVVDTVYGRRRDAALAARVDAACP